MASYPSSQGNGKNGSMKALDMRVIDAVSETAPPVGLLAVGAGASVATLYYSQPMLGTLGPALGASPETVGAIPMLTQLGYAGGILLLAPLGDRLDRKRLIQGKAIALFGALLVATLAPNASLLLAASLVIGVAATMTQDIVPAAATLAPERHRGKVVGTVMTGLLLGILLSRVLSGFVSEFFGWRTMFAGAALSVAGVGFALSRRLPSFAPTTDLPYRKLLASLATLWRQHPSLRQAAYAQGLLSIGFSAFWSTLALVLHGAPYHLGSAAAGAFGLAGAIGALAAPIAGALSDRRGPGLVTRVGSGLVALTFAAMATVHLSSPGAALAFLAVGVVLFDLGIQATLIAHQTVVYSVDPGARSRLNAILIGGMFSGMALGALLGSLLFTHFGWSAVPGLAALTALGALAIRLRAK